MLFVSDTAPTRVQEPLVQLKIAVRLVSTMCGTLIMRFLGYASHKPEVRTILISRLPPGNEFFA